MPTPDFNPLHTDDRPDDAFEATWRRAFRRRLLAVGAIFALWTGGIQARLIYLQVIQHPHYLAVADDQHTRAYEPPAKRGDLLDRNGEVLAYSADASTVAVNPRAVADAAGTIGAICRVFGDCSAKERATLISTIEARRSYFAFVRRGVSAGMGARIAALELPGVSVQAESRRYYPNRELAAHLLGFVGRENTGLGGIEHAYDELIAGRKGRTLMLIDAKHNAVEQRVEREPTEGATIELTIDKVLQHFAETEIRTAVLGHAALAGTLVAMDPSTGEILALANYPTFNPNTPLGVDAMLRSNRAVQSVYEPGSTFKIVTAAAAIEEGVLSPEDAIDTAPGIIRIPGRSKPVDDEHPYGVLSFEDVIVKSSNVGAIKAGWQIGAERLNRYVRRFGFGEIHAPDFRGVSGGIVWPPEALDLSGLASVSMGYQVSVTPMQMVAATAAVANGGVLFEPHLVRAVIRDGVREEIAPKALRRAILPATAATLTTIMEGVVQRGTAKTAQLVGYQAAGKTGTSQRVLETGGYSDDHVGSFTGFAPSRNPALAVLVVIDSPQRGGYYGGVVAAPAFQRFMQAALRHLRVPPTLTPATPHIVQSGTALPARFDVLTPPAAATVMRVDDVLTMPDVRGLGFRQATQVLTELGLLVRASGTGVVTAQVPEPGTPVLTGGTGRLQLARVPARAAGGGR